LLSADQLPLQADRFLVQTNLLSQQPILVSQMDQLFFLCHALTLHAGRGFGRSLVLQRDFLEYTERKLVPGGRIQWLSWSM
jgi:hypothetical protein